MRRVLMVTPHFPPDSSAAAHRVRLLAPYLPAAGWTPTIVTVSASVATPRVKSRSASAPTTSTMVLRVVAKPWSSALIRYGPGGSATAR